MSTVCIQMEKSMNTAEIDGKKYYLIPIEEYMGDRIGRKEIREYLECNNNTLSRKPWMFPDFGVALKGHTGLKPYTRQQVLDWLAIPENKRRRLYMESLGGEYETNKQD